MADSLNDLQLFTAIVNAGAITRAAGALNSSPPAVSRRLAALEKRLGVRLIERHARRFKLTEAGQNFHDRALRILADLEDAEAEASSHAHHLKGRLRIGAMFQNGRHSLAPEIARFALRYPDLQVELVMSDDPLDVVEDDLDILFQPDLPVQDTVVAQRIVDSRLIICASPDYLKRKGHPRTAADLLKHDCLCLSYGRTIYRNWRLTENGQQKEIEVHPRLVCNNGETLYDWVLAGYGIGVQFEWNARKDLEAGRLIMCFDSHWSVSWYAVYPHRRVQPAKIKALLDYLAERRMARQST
ncbi:MAG: LysR family transcriptional regulator [Pusillimonas sp.]